MSTISFYNSSTISSLFSSLNGTNSNSGFNGIFSGIDLNTYNSIRSGGYAKLMRAYYAKQEDSVEDTDADNTVKPEASQKVNAVSVRDSAASLVDSAKDFQKASMWSRKTTTDSEGKTVTDYDTDAIYKAVSGFVDDYNALVSGTGKSGDTAVLRSAANMVSYTRQNTDLLKDIGVSIGIDNKLKIDEDTFKKADMTTVKSLFKGQGSFGMSVSSRAASIYSSAVSQLAKQATTNTYTSAGTYNYISASAYDKYL
ncbi:MAG: hypothetical protein Q4F11_01320 [Eubacteriales bacterium]|nr:hypothetical protein [Eubacteriales bacterium]